MRLEEEAEKILERIHVEGYLDSLSRLYIAYSGSWYAPAASYTMYWPLRQLAQDIRVEVAPVESLLYHVFAYSRGEDEAFLVYYSEPGTENFVGRVLAATRVFGIKSLIVVPPIPESIIQQRLEKLHEIVVLASEKLPQLFILFSAKLTAKILDLVKSEITVRKERVIKEFSDVSMVYESLLERYSREASLVKDGLREAGSVGLYYSTTMQPTALYWSYVIEEKYRVYTHLHPLSAYMSRLGRARMYDLSILLTTDAEEDITREALFKTSHTQDSRLLATITLHTDPLTAPVYGCLLAELL